MESEVRADKYLWAMRLYKTRSLASESCKKGRVLLDDKPLKPSHTLKNGDVFKIVKTPVTYTYRILQITGKRLGAKLVDKYLEDITPEKDLEILEMQKKMGFKPRKTGTGRPTKKERRDLDQFLEE